MTFRNPDGTFNGVKLLASLSGCSEAEVRWTVARLNYLMHTEGKTREEAKAIIIEEAKRQPWIDAA